MKASVNYTDCPLAPGYRAEFLKDLTTQWNEASPDEEMPVWLLDALQKAYSQGMNDGAGMVLEIIVAKMKREKVNTPF